MIFPFIKRAWMLWPAVMAAGLSMGKESGAGELAKGFAQPPAEARPWVWGHWLHGNVDKASITRQLEAMARVGLGGMTMFDVAQQGIPAGPHKYMEGSWRELFSHQIAEAKRLGLEVMTQNGPGYSGNGGPWIAPELASQKIVESATRLEGGKRFQGKLPLPPAEGGFYRDVAVLALCETDAQAQPKIEDLDMKRLVWLNYIRWRGTRSAPPGAALPQEQCIPRSHVVDLTERMAEDGSIEWEVPEGQWTLLRFGHTWTGQKTLPATPEGHGPECDKLDKRGIRAHFDHVMKRMVKLAGPAAGKTFHTFFLDSWEGGGQNWTPRMREEFQRRRGYDIIPFLPVLTGRVIDDLQTSERFLFDLRQTVSELVNENFWAELRRLCHAHGMRVAVQPYITMGNDFDASNFTDEPMGEFWAIPNVPGNDYSQTVKLASSAANLNGHLIVGAEAFTSTARERWLSHPARLKEQGDRMFCLGANRFQFHRFAMQRFPQLKPGMMMGGWGQQYDATQTWWEWSGAWHAYLARCQYLLRQGPVVTDLLCLPSEEPLERFVHQPVEGYNYDVCGPDTFRRIEMVGGKPGIAGGPAYPLIRVGHHGYMTVERARKLRDLVMAGAAVLGEPPVATPGLGALPQADDELRSLVAEIWGTTGESDRRVGKGRVFRGIPAGEALQRLGVVPDFSGPAGVSWIHRRAEDLDIYFVASSSEQPFSPLCTFRVSGKVAELWDPMTGSMVPLETTEAGDGRTAARIPLESFGSAFVVFRSGTPPDPAVRNVTLNGKPVDAPQTASPLPREALAESFTYAVWAKPAVEIGLPKQVAKGFPGLKDRRNDAMYPPPGHFLLGKGNAFSGLSIGTNGVVVYEHGSDYFAPVLVHRGRIDGWTHVTVIYQKGRPALFLNGRQVAKGLKGPQKVHCPVGFGEGQQTVFQGRLGYFDAFAEPLDQARLSAWLKNRKPAPDDRIDADVPVKVVRCGDGGRTLVAHQPGTVGLEFADGSRREIEVNPRPAMELKGPWQLEFPKESGVHQPLQVERLTSWSLLADREARHHSGVVRYQTGFDLPESGGAVELDLGQVEVMARVRLNGQDLGVLWRAPYRVDLGKAAKAGRNRLEIDVVNLWVNRLIGDSLLPQDSTAERNEAGRLVEWPKWVLEGKTSPTGRRTFVTFPLWNANEPLRPSGLLGPVVLRFPHKVEL